MHPGFLAGLLGGCDDVRFRVEAARPVAQPLKARGLGRREPRFIQVLLVIPDLDVVGQRHFGDPESFVVVLAMST